MLVYVTRLSGPSPNDNRVTVFGPLQSPLQCTLRGEWEETPYRGAASPHLGFSHNAAQTQSFQFVICASLEEYDEWTLDDVQKDREFLEKLVYGEVDEQQAFLRPPPYVIIVVGNPAATAGDGSEPVRKWVGVIRGLDLTEKPPMDPGTGLPYGYDVTLDLLITQPRIGAMQLVPAWPNLGDLIDAGVG